MVLSWIRQHLFTRFGAATSLWLKRSLGTRSDKGCRWVERILSLRQTCRLRKRSTFDTLAEAFTCYFNQQSPDLEWIRQPFQA